MRRRPRIDARVGLMLTFAIALVAPAGCGGSATAPAAAAISWEVRGDSGGVAVGAGEGGTAQAGNNKLVIANGRLTANGKDAGEFKNGDKVLLDKDGQIYVNGEKRETR
jgi:hypothetical protein